MALPCLPFGPTSHKPHSAVLGSTNTLSTLGPSDVLIAPTGARCLKYSITMICWDDPATGADNGNETSGNALSGNALSGKPCVLA